ncbi:AAA family ATPase [Nocardioides sp. Root151]|uniref:AAA family ATPase n=2 Tax=Nocardioides TaxID=1839 RepID=UPI0006FEDA79|nr:ATP-binding protein [Nocardioides sp. Root151]KQY64295.1 hypothetical protein ASD30_04950 [Nocardioides sp. Root140]KQZ70214.1 hypothetical protein ASD66_11225 [Nocardioides sp. Root151]KRF16311.1 hypothetical protein ASH02_06975 [Nocardioides sp. Soil796]
MVGLPGAGKTAQARRIEADTGALRLTPDEWMVPLFGHTDEAEKRALLEGRFIWVAHQSLRGGLSVILDFGCWSIEERYAIRDVAARAEASFSLHHLEVGEAERRARAEVRWQRDTTSAYEMSSDDHDGFLASFTPPTAAEVAGEPLPAAPRTFESWSHWASQRWPSLPRLDLS